MKAIIAILALVPSVASATCAPREQIMQVIEGKYAEDLVATGHNPKAIFETFANPKTGTWTMIANTPSGITCVVASGVDYHIIPAGEAL